DALVPPHDDVVARRETIDDEVPVGARGGEERIIEHEENRAHVRMNVTEDLHDAGLREHYRFGVAARVATEVEGLRAREREDVVEDVVLVRERDHGATNHGQDMWREALVALPNGH